MHVRHQEPADVAHGVAELLEPCVEDGARLGDGPATVDQHESVVGLDDVDVDRAQSVHRQRQRHPVHARRYLERARLGPLAASGPVDDSFGVGGRGHFADATNPRPVIGGRSLAKTSPGCASQIACTALTSRMAVTIIPETLWSPSSPWWVKSMRITGSPSTSTR